MIIFWEGPPKPDRSSKNLQTFFKIKIGREKSRVHPQNIIVGGEGGLSEMFYPEKSAAHFYVRPPKINPGTFLEGLRWTYIKSQLVPEHTY